MRLSGVALIAALWLLIVTCGTSDPSARFGPAAVVPGESGDDMEAAVSGTLSMTPECVLLEAPTTEILLVFRDEQVSWDGEARRLRFESENGTLALADGSEVTLGGGGSSAIEDGVSTEDYVAQRDWVDPPHGDCWRGSRFEVHSVQVPPGQPTTER